MTFDEPLVASSFHLLKNQYETTSPWWLNLLPQRRLDFQVSAHYHPLSGSLIEALHTKGLDGVLDPIWHDNLRRPLHPDTYEFGDRVASPHPVEEIDVSDGGSYAPYNWELLFHGPVLIATHLSKNQRFAEAQRWFHFVFDPTSTENIPPPARFWRFLRFRNETSPDSIADKLERLADGSDLALIEQVTSDIQEWRANPFHPHAIARTRVIAYQLNVVMKYLDNLLAWGDHLFRQDTIESMNEATQVYVLAANILGPKPQESPRRARVQPRSYAQLKAESASGVDTFGNALIELENEFPFDASGVPGGGGADATAAFGVARSLYFCIPPNPKLLSYWDEVADRLFKLRHCMNIEGVVRQPALFDPPIDPGALVKAAAAGIDIASIVNNVNQPVSTRRGRVLLGMAKELTSEVKALGAAVLAAVEKGEAEQLAAIRQSHEVAALRLGRDIRYLQWKETEAATEALLTSRATTWERYRHYKRILGADEGELEDLRVVELVRAELDEETFDEAHRELVEAHTRELARESYRKETTVGGLMEFAGEVVVSQSGGEMGDTLPLNKNEHAELNVYLPSADSFSTLSTILSLTGSVLGLIPQFDAAGKPMGVGVEVGFGGVQLKAAADAGATYAEKIAAAFTKSADRASKLAGYYRRAEDYVLQANVAASELEHLGRQVIGSLIREQIAKREYESHEAQIERAIEVDEFQHSKFSNAELYGWMQGQLSQTHYECYKLAYDVTKRAEKTLQFELMDPAFDELDIIDFSYWDSGRKGLLAGERLSLDIHRLELALLEHDRQEYELTKHVSLRRLDPRALLRLRSTGACEFEIPEWLFDLDSPGQFMRRIKSVAVTIPAVTGPYAGVHAKLSLTRSTIRTSSLLGDGYARDPDGDERFRDFTGAIQSIVTSTARNDAGLFEVPLEGERRLPFEGAGAHSFWRIQLPESIRAFDYSSISDVIVHVRYTARESGHLADPATQYILDEIVSRPDAALHHLLSLRTDHPNEWHAFRTATDDANRALSIRIDPTTFPYWARRVGLDDGLAATFAVSDIDRSRLTVAPAPVQLAGDADSGWTLDVDQTSPVFGFLKAHANEDVQVNVDYRVSP
ncbi:hypothetical protein [uncultured Serinicoccus sp.]|uniref:Tc toxin subunit A-related protein n=1 Tax=uncultured Serinicoccus sp. TaxID=735514 RepID=UPI00260F1CC8|nr:hypothetical protein [uncultured Serinicoccus sp.]